MNTQTDSCVYFGDTLKALDDDGRVGGYLVRFTDADHKDLDGEFFTEKTYLGPKDGDGVDTYFHHARTIPIPKDANAEVKEELKALRDYVFGPIKTKRDAIGVFAEVVLDMSKKYEELVHGFVKKGLLGWSSGAISHLVRKTDGGELKRWPIGEASLTPTPAEPQNRALALKSLDLLPLKMFPRAASKGLLAEEMAETTPSWWQVESAFYRLVRKIAEGAKNADVTGEFDWRAKINQLGTEFGSEASAIAIIQVEEFLNSSDDEFHLKGIAESESFESFFGPESGLDEFVAKMQHLHEIRVKENRVLSTANRAKVQAAYDALGELLEASELKPKEKQIDMAVLRTQHDRVENRLMSLLTQ